MKIFDRTTYVYKVKDYGTKSPTIEREVKRKNVSLQARELNYLKEKVKEEKSFFKFFRQKKEAFSIVSMILKKAGSPMAIRKIFKL